MPTPPTSSTPPPDAPGLDRRRFLHTSCAALMALGAGSLTLAACDAVGAEDGPVVGDPGITREGDTLVIDTEQVAALAAAGGSLWVSDVHVLVVHTAEIGYRAFDSVCPHEGHSIRVFEQRNGMYRLRCPTHGWTFDLNGDPTGSARRGTERLPLVEDGPLLRITL